MIYIYFHLIVSYLILSNFGCLMSWNNFTFWAGLHGMSFLLHRACQRFNRWSNFAGKNSTRDSVSQCDVINWSPSFSFSQFRSCPPKEIRVDHAIMRLGSTIFIGQEPSIFSFHGPSLFQSLLGTAGLEAVINLYIYLYKSSFQSLLRFAVLEVPESGFKDVSLCENNLPLKRSPLT